MKPFIDGRIRLQAPRPHVDGFRAEVLHGLRQPQKQLPCKFFYDERGSALFEQICDLEEYYLTRTELAILRRFAGEMAATLGPGCRVVEYGSGSSIKTRILLDHLDNVAAYVPIDISREPLLHAARAMAAAYPGIEILPVCGDYTADLRLPDGRTESARTMIYFPGSTIGNFEPDDAQRFLRRMREVCGRGGGLLIGVDLKKDPRVLHAAYNDAAGVTAAFNSNILARVNRELDGDLRLDQFAHYAFYNAREGRVEMHLVSLERQAARVGTVPFHFCRGESIFTESSYKYTLEEFARLAMASGYSVERVWTDDRQWFSVQCLAAV